MNLIAPTFLYKMSQMKKDLLMKCLYNSIFPSKLLSDASDALKGMAEIDLRYQAYSDNVTASGFWSSRKIRERLAHRQMRERLIFEDEFSTAHDRMSEIMLNDLMSPHL